MDELLSLREVRLHYLRGGRHVVRVLEDVSLRLWAGEVVCVLAQRAQGKTTLLRVAAGMERPAAGRVSFDGIDVWGMADERRARLLAGEIGWVTADAPELAAPVLEHVAMPALDGDGQRQARTRARQALRRVGAADCASCAWGDLGDREHALVALARGIVREPRLLAVDDLTVALGLHEADEIMRLLHSLAGDEGIGVLASVSDARETRWSDRIATLAGGELLMPSDGPGRAGGKVVRFPDGGRHGLGGG